LQREFELLSQTSEKEKVQFERRISELEDKEITLNEDLVISYGNLDDKNRQIEALSSKLQGNYNIWYC